MSSCNTVGGDTCICSDDKEYVNSSDYSRCRHRVEKIVGVVFDGSTVNATAQESIGNSNIAEVIDNSNVDECRSRA